MVEGLMRHWRLSGRAEPVNAGWVVVSGDPGVADGGGDRPTARAGSAAVRATASSRMSRRALPFLSLPPKSFQRPPPNAASASSPTLANLARKAAMIAKNPSFSPPRRRPAPSEAIFSNAIGRRVEISAALAAVEFE